jgi:protoporphyrinogen oxidase
MSVTPIPVVDAGWAPRITQDGRSSFATWRRSVGLPPSGVAMTAEHHRLETMVGEVAQAGRCYPGLTLAGAWYHGPGIAGCVRSGEQTATSCRPVAGPGRRAAS